MYAHWKSSIVYGRPKPPRDWCGVGLLRTAGVSGGRRLIGRLTASIPPFSLPARPPGVQVDDRIGPLFFVLNLFWLLIVPAELYLLDVLEVDEEGRLLFILQAKSEEPGINLEEGTTDHIGVIVAELLHPHPLANQGSERNERGVIAVRHEIYYLLEGLFAMPKTRAVRYT